MFRNRCVNKHEGLTNYKTQMKHMQTEVKGKPTHIHSKQLQVTRSYLSVNATSKKSPLTLFHTSKENAPNIDVESAGHSEAQNHI